jgi:hypothetical protein
MKFANCAQKSWLGTGSVYRVHKLALEIAPDVLHSHLYRKRIVRKNKQFQISACAVLSGFAGKGKAHTLGAYQEDAKRYKPGKLSNKKWVLRVEPLHAFYRADRMADHA